VGHSIAYCQNAAQEGFGNNWLSILKLKLWIAAFNPPAIRRYPHLWTAKITRMGVAEATP
jgi:hypothetical protein